MDANRLPRHRFSVLMSRAVDNPQVGLLALGFFAWLSAPAPGHNHPRLADPAPEVVAAAQSRFGIDLDQVRAILDDLIGAGLVTEARS